MTKIHLIIFFINTYVFQIKSENNNFIPKIQMPKLKRNLMLIKEDCGEVCDTSDNFSKTPGLYFDKIFKNFNCDYLFESPLIDGYIDVSEQQIRKKDSIAAPFKEQVSEDILNLYTFDGRIKIGRVGIGNFRLTLKIHGFFTPIFNNFFNFVASE